MKESAKYLHGNLKGTAESADHDACHSFGGNHEGKQETPFVGMWKDREDIMGVDPYLRELRKGRLEKRL